MKFQLQTIIVLVALSVFCFPGIRLCQGQDLDPATALDEIEVQYEFGEFNEAQQAAVVFLDRTDISFEQRLTARILLTRLYLGLDEETLARISFCAVLQLDENWRPDEISFRQDQISIFEEARADCVQ